MVVPSLTREHAIRRSTLLKVTSYTVKLDFSMPTAATFRSDSTITFDAAPGGGETWVDAIADRIESVTLNGRQPDIACVSTADRIRLSWVGTGSNILRVVAHMPYSNNCEGVHRFTDPADGEIYLYTHLHPANARRVFAAFDQPDLKAPITFIVTAPACWTVISNSEPCRRVDHGDGIATTTFAATRALATYAAAVIAGPVRTWSTTLISSDGGEIPARWHARASLAEYVDVQALHTTTADGMRYFENRFGHPYPFDSYDQVFVPELSVGAMENAGAVTFPERYIFRGRTSAAQRRKRHLTVLHEMAHMWFGDLVTMKWWDDLWLSESFADYASTLAAAHLATDHDPWVAFNADRKTWAYHQDLLPTTHPVIVDVPDVDARILNFDGITYGKGASALKQLVAVLGEDTFFSAVTAYFRRYAYATATMADLVRELESAAGRNLDSWVQAWLTTTGVNVLSAQMWSPDTPNQTLTCQQMATSSGTHRPHHLEVGLFDLDNAAAVRVHTVQIDITDTRTTTPLPDDHNADFVLPNYGDLTYGIIRLDNRSLDRAHDFLRACQDPLARALVWGSLWESTRASLLSPDHFIGIALAAVEFETDPTTAQAVLDHLRVAVDEFTAPEHHAQKRTSVADRLWTLLGSVPRSNDLALQLTRSFSNLAWTSKHAANLTELQTQTSAATDPDLVWELTIGRVATGHAAKSDIDNALSEDRTARGAEYAARAHATIPTLEAKNSAWQQVSTDLSLSNSIVSAIGAGYRTSGDSALFQSQTTEYFQRIDGIWATFSSRTAQSIIRDFYPPASLGETGTQAARIWLTAPNHSPNLLRVIRENHAERETALRAQQLTRSTAGLPNPL